MKAKVLRALVVALVASSVVGVAHPASATPVDLACVFSATVTFSPGVALLPQNVHFTGTAEVGRSVSSLTPCSSVLTGVPYTGADGPVSGSGQLGCQPLGFNGSLVGSVSGTFSATWNNGDTSTIFFSATLVGVVPVVTASVIAGALQGSSIPAVGIPTGITGNCLTPITGISLAGIVVFSQL
jgi:hypothetical protein